MLSTQPHKLLQHTDNCKYCLRFKVQKFLLYKFKNGSAHTVVERYSELYEEGEVKHINGVWPVFF